MLNHCSQTNVICCIDKAAKLSERFYLIFSLWSKLVGLWSKLVEVLTDLIVGISKRLFSPQILLMGTSRILYFVQCGDCIFTFKLVIFSCQYLDLVTTHVCLKYHYYYNNYFKFYNLRYIDIERLKNRITIKCWIWLIWTLELWIVIDKQCWIYDQKVSKQK